MPKISELPAGNALNGSELIVIVQEGETRKTSLSALVQGATVPSLSGAHWIRVSGQETPINEIALTTHSGDWDNGFSATAVVVSVKDNTDVLWWAHQFEVSAVLDDGIGGYVDTLGDGAEILLSDGGYRINLYDSGPSQTGTAQYSVNGGNSRPLTVVGEAEEFTVPFGETHSVTVSATDGASVIIFRIGGFVTGGEALPTIYDSGNQLTVSYSGQDTPKNGVLTATARIYRDSVLVEESDPITLTVNATSNEPPPPQS